MKYINSYPDESQMDSIKESLKRVLLRRLIDDLVESDTIHRVKEIRAVNSDYFRLWPILDRFAERAMIRIRHLEIVKKIYWKEFNN